MPFAQKYRSTEEFKKYSHFRNGVEAIPSLNRRKYYVDKIPVHGRLRTKLYFGFKIAAINITRFCKFKQDLYCHAKNEKLG